MANSTTWKGNDPSAPVMTVCTHMPPMLNELARLVTIECKAAGVPDFYVKGIGGFGSFRSNTASAGTDNGSHIDLDFRGLTDRQRKIGEACARKIGFYADIRLPRWWSAWYGKWLTASWWPHCHMLPVGDPHNSSAANAQIHEWIYDGENGLAGNDKDDGPRTFVGRTWAAYLAIRDAVVNVGSAVVIDAKVRGIQHALRQTVDGKLGSVTYRAVWRLSLASREGRSGFLKLSDADRKALQRDIGCKFVDGKWSLVGSEMPARLRDAVGGVQRAMGVPIDRVWTDAVEGYQFKRLYTAAGFKP